MAAGPAQNLMLVTVAVVRELGLPIQFVGAGEKVEDLLPFNPREFVASLFET